MITRWTARLAAAQVSNPGRFLWVALLCLAASLGPMSQLRLNSSWTAMLPSDKPSVADLKLTEARVGGLNELAVVLSGADTAGLIAFARDLVPRVQGLVGQERVFAIEWNVAEYEDFVYAHRHLYADLDSLRETRDELQIRLDYERLKHNPFYVNLEEEPPSPRELIDRMQSKADAGKQKLARFPEGFYVHPDGGSLVLFVRTDISGGDADSTARLVTRLTSEADLSARALDVDNIRIEFAGSLMAALEEHRAVKEELIASTVLTAVAVLAAILLFFRKKRAPVLLFIGVSVPTIMAFAVARLTVHELNTSTAFLGSIVLGNGVNPHIIWLARYFEVRRRGETIARAVIETHRTTLVATLAAASAAALSFASLMLTDFKGFRDFGIIACVGMFLCWSATYLLLPAATVLADRRKPLAPEPGVESGTVYGRAFWAIVRSAPRTLVASGIVLSVVSAVLVTRAIAADPIEYDFRRLKSVREESSQVATLNRRIGETVPGGGEGNSIALLVPEREQAKPLRDELVRRRDEAGAPFGSVTAIDDLLPTDQDAKIPVLAEIRQLLLDARKYVTEPDDLRQLDDNIPAEEQPLVGEQDLPESVARRFTERDGTRGRILFVGNQKSTEQTAAPSIWDGRYLIAWSRALRDVRLSDGTRPPLAGRAPVFADMVDAVLQDGPIAVGASLAVTILLITLSFRRMRERLATLGSLLVGVLWMTGAMALAGMKLNFLNFVAFPITFGNGSDYAINVMQRFRAELAHPAQASANEGEDAPAQRAIRVAVQQSGGAVILCSLTTVIGYTSLFVSANQALNSFGAAMAISELTCLAAAVIVLPAAIWLMGSRSAP